MHLSLIISAFASLGVASVSATLGLNGVAKQFTVGSTRACSDAALAGSTSFLTNGQYASVPSALFNAAQAPCGLSIVVTNDAFPDYSKRFSNIVIVDECTSCADGDILLGPGAFGQVSNGTAQFNVAWYPYN